jgi:hypothetical protein
VRLKIVIAVLLLALGLLSIIAFVSRKVSPTAGSGIAESNVSPSENSATTQPPVTVPKPEPNVSVAIPAPATAALPDTNHAAYVRQRIAELDALAMNNDAASLETILSELHNPDRQIRKGALEAAIQFDDRAAIPRLKEIAAQTEDEDEKEEILKAADYLNLPSLTEYLAQQQAQREALGLTNPPPRPRTNRPARNFPPRQSLPARPPVVPQ